MVIGKNNMKWMETIWHTPNKMRNKNIKMRNGNRGGG